MGRFVLVPWGDGGRGGKEGGVVEIRVGEGETVGGSLGGEGGV